MKNLVSALILASAFVLPSTAHADAIDDFVLTGVGNSNVITFSLPASPPGNESTCPTGIVTSCLPGSETAFYLSTLVTTNGVSSVEGLAFPTQRFGGGLYIGATQFTGGQTLFTPNAATPTFLLGTFEVSTFTPIYGQYSLQITQESPIAATPEPSTLGLLGTGVLGLFGFVQSKRGRASV